MLTVPTDYSCQGFDFPSQLSPDHLATLAGLLEELLEWAAGKGSQ